MPMLILILLLAGLPAYTSAATVRLPVTADAGISSERGCFEQNGGASVSVPIRQNQNWYGFETKACLLRFDTDSLRGMSVKKAWLNIYLAAGDLYGIGLCSVLADWEEGEGINGETGMGGASWLWAREPQAGKQHGPENYWSWPGSRVYSVSWAHPDLRYSHAGPAEIQREQAAPDVLHLRFPVAPELVSALAAGLVTSLVLTDDKGQVAEGQSIKGQGTPYVYDRSKDIYMYTREVQEPSYRPFLEVEAVAEDHTPPGPAGPLTVTSTDPYESAVTVSFKAPAEDGVSGGAVLGYEARYAESVLDGNRWEKYERLPRWLVPRPGAPGGKDSLRVSSLAPGKYHLGLRALDEAGNLGPLSQCEITVPGAEQVMLERPRPAEEIAGSAEAVYENLLQLWACSDLTKVDPLTGGILRDTNVYVDNPKMKIEDPVWKAARRTVYLEALRGEVVAFQLILERLGDTSLSDIRIVPDDFIGNGGVLKVAGNLSCYRVWYMKAVPGRADLIGPGDMVDNAGQRTAWHGDACLPLNIPFESTFNLPALDNLGGEQRCQSVWVDLYVPPNTRPGRYQGKVTVTARELKRPAVLILELEVLPPVLPDRVSWVVDLNAYEYGIQALFGFKSEVPPARLRLIEKRFYQMAHQHRATLNILPYSQSGQVHQGCAPEIKMSPAGPQVSSWKEWDGRYAQYLNGRAFTAEEGYRGPGAGVPVEQMYLPIHENWPMPLKGHYADWAELKNREEYGEWAKKSRPLEQAMDKQYQAGIASITRQLFEHFRKSGFTGTNFQVYFNNKYYFKCHFFGMPNEGEGTSFWLLDEPVDYDDYAANRFFLSLVRQGYLQAKPGAVKLHLRTDVSQPELTRGLWDNGVCNLWNSSGLFDFGTTARFRMQRNPEEKYWHYGAGPAVWGRLAELQSSFFTYWSIGTVGDLPYWDSLRGEGWIKPSDLAVFYPGAQYAGSGKDYDGPIAGVRLKAIRRAQQDIEYLDLLAAKPGWNKARVRQALAAWADDPQAPVLTFKKLTVGDLFDLRKAISGALRSN